MEINGIDIRYLRNRVLGGGALTGPTALQLIDYAIACESVHDDELIEDERAGWKFMRGLMIASLISGMAQYWIFKWLFLSSGWF